MTSTIKNVVVFGASGNVGLPVLEALQKHSFNPTAVVRSSSSAKFAQSIKVAKIADDFPAAELQAVLRGQDAVICALTATTPAELTKRIIDVAADEGVKHFIPGEFSISPKGIEHLGYGPMKTVIRDHLKLKESKGMSWTALMTGPFFDWGINNEWLGFSIAKKEARIWDGGDVTWSATALPDIGEATIQVLLRADEVKNQSILISSLETSQNEMLKVFEAETGTKWKVTHVKAEEEKKRGQELMEKGDFLEGIKLLLLNVIYVDGFDSDFSKAGLLGNDELGLQQQDLSQIIRHLLQEQNAA